MNQNNFVTRMTLFNGVAFLSVPKNIKSKDLSILKAYVDLQLKAYEDLVNEREFVGPVREAVRKE